jgi:hypothetical protein
LRNGGGGRTIEAAMSRVANDLRRVGGVVALALALASLVWIGGLTWNWVSNRGDLSREEVQGILSTPFVAAACEPMQRLRPFPRHWDYRCEFSARPGPTVSALKPLKPRALSGVVLVRVDEHAITGERFPSGSVISR